MHQRVFVSRPQSRTANARHVPSVWTARHVPSVQSLSDRAWGNRDDFGRNLPTSNIRHSMMREPINLKFSLNIEKNMGNFLSYVRKFKFYFEVAFRASEKVHF